MATSVKGKGINLRVRFNKEWEEWTVQVRINGKYNEVLSYVASDRDDAKMTAVDMAARFRRQGAESVTIT